MLLLIYTFSVNFWVSVLLINSFFYYSAIHLKLSVSLCMCERNEEGDMILADPTLYFFHKVARKFSLILYSSSYFKSTASITVKKLVYTRI